MPRSAYVLPEDSALPIDDKISSVSLGAALAPSVDGVLDATSRAVNFAGSSHPAASADEWRLAYLKTDLGISASGLFGLLVLQGSSAVSLRWYEKGTSVGRVTSPVPTIHFSPSRPISQSLDELEPLVETLAIGGGVRDVGRLRAELRDRAQRFLEYAQSIKGVAGDEWSVTGFRAELNIDVSGMVSPSVVAGGQLTVRFEWERLECKIPTRVEPRWPGLRELVQAIAEDLGTVSREAFAGTPYLPHAMSLGLGVSASGDFGVVKASGSLIGTVLFANDVPPPPRAPMWRASRLDEIAVLEENAPERHRRFADRMGIRYEPDGDAIDDFIFKIARWRFRRGLERTARLGRGFAERVGELPLRKWSPYELAINFQLSVGGFFGLVTVGGLASAELDLYHL